MSEDQASQGASRKRQRERTEQTRARLMQAAHEIFARDGFEAARLEDIAAAAGYTRGAFYANFESKSDLFVALLEEQMARRSAALREKLDGMRTPVEKLDAVKAFYVEQSQDHEWSLLMLEFKLFAIRHPEQKRRLALLHRKMMGSPLLQELYQTLGLQLQASKEASRLALGAFSQALTLEHLLDPDIMPERDMATLLAQVFDAVAGRRGAGRSGPGRSG